MQPLSRSSLESLSKMFKYWWDSDNNHAKGSLYLHFYEWLSWSTSSDVWRARAFEQNIQYVHSGHMVALDG